MATTSASERPRMPQAGALEAVSQILHSLTLLLPLRQTLNRIATDLSAMMGFKACAILLPTDDGQRMWPEGSYGMPQEYLIELTHERPVRLTHTLTLGPTARAFTLGRAVEVRDTQQDPIFAPWRSLAEVHGYRSMVSVPLMIQERIIGVLNGYSAEPRVLSAEDLVFLQAMADQAAIAIELARRLQQQAQTIQKLEETSAKLQEQHRVLEQSEAIHRALTEQVLTGAGLPAIAKAIAGLVQNPVLVWDAYENLIAGFDPAGQPLDRWGGLIRIPYVQRRLLQLQRERRPLRLPASRGEGLEHSVVFKAVLAGSRLDGFIALVERDRPAGQLDFRALEHGATVAALEHMKELAVRAAESQRREEFIRALMKGQFDGDEAMVQRGRSCGCDLLRLHRVVVFSPHELGRFADRHELQASRVRDTFVRTTAEVCGEMAPGSMVASIGDYAVAICPVGQEDAAKAERLHKLAARVQSLLRKAIPGLQVCAGIGQVCRQPGDYAGAYTQARQCIRLLERLDRNERSLAFEDLGVFRVLLFNVQDPKRLAEQIQEVINPLMAHDGEKGTELFRTLTSYLENNCDAHQTARALFVHPNTLKYRLMRISELTGRDLKQPYQFMELALAVTALHATGIAAEEA